MESWLWCGYVKSLFPMSIYVMPWIYTVKRKSQDGEATPAVSSREGKGHTTDQSTPGTSATKGNNQWIPFPSPVEKIRLANQITSTCISCLLNANMAGDCCIISYFSQFEASVTHRSSTCVYRAFLTWSLTACQSVKQWKSGFPTLTFIDMLYIMVVLRANCLCFHNTNTNVFVSSCS